MSTKVGGRGGVGVSADLPQQRGDSGDAQKVELGVLQ